MRFSSLFLTAAAVALVLCTAPGTASACKFVPDQRPLAVQLEDVKLAFVGTVTSVEDGIVEFSIEKALVGQSGKKHRFKQDKSSCAIRFTAGERWLFAGEMQRSPSRLLQDSYGRDTEGLEDAQSLLVTAGVERSPILKGGTVTPSCAPWDGPAFTFEGPHGRFPGWSVGRVRGTVFAPIEKENGGMQVFRTKEDGTPEFAANSAGIEVERNGGWERVPGTVTAAWELDGDLVLRVDTTPYFGVIAFRPVILKGRALCG